jgi:DNA repair exonuclease SbcCD ATPase subunit
LGEFSISIGCIYLLNNMAKHRLYPLPIPTKCPRDYSKISKTWWAKKREEKMAAIAEQLTKLQGESEAEHAKHREEIDKRENDRCTLEREKAEITAALDDAVEAYAEKSLELEEAQPCKGSHFLES